MPMTENERTLSNKGAFSRILFEQSPLAMQIYNPDGDVVKANKSWERFWRVSAETAVAHNNILQDEQARKIGLTAAFQQALLGNSTILHDVEYNPHRISTKGRKKFFHIRMFPLRIDDDQIEGVVCVLEDTTDMIALEVERRSYWKRLEHEVDVRTRQLEGLLQFSTKLIGFDALQSVYTFIISQTKNVLEFDHSTLLIISEESGQLVVAATIGFPQSMAGTFVLLENHGLPSLVAKQRSAAVVEDFQTEQRFAVPDAIFEHKLTSALAVPMMNKDKIIGVLIGHTRAGKIFSENEITLYQNYANLSAVALSNIMSMESLKRSKERVRQLFENASDAIYLVDVKTGRIVDCNHKAVVLDGYSRQEMLSMKMSDIFPEEEHELLRQQRRQLIKNGFCTTMGTFHVHHLRKDGLRVPVEGSASIVETDDRQLIMNIVRDISSRKAMEREREIIAAKLQRSRRMESIGLMAGGIAHDLNNILSGVISYPELLMMRLAEDDPIREDLQKIMEAGKRASGVTSDLLTIARGAANVKETLSLNALIKKYLVSPEFCKLISLHPKVAFIPRLDSKVKNIHCSTLHLQKVLLNLATNAAEAITGTGQVVISTCHRVVERETGHGVLPGEYTVLRVQDNGSGISEQDLEHIFDPFYTTKVMGRSGTGLGLAVVWNTVQDHNGFVNVDSDAGGTTFTLYFPVADSQERFVHTPDREKSLIELHGKGKILVVDDEQVQRDIAVKILQHLGYMVTAKSSGEECLAFLQENAVDLVVLDMIMEPGINGRQTYEQMTSIHPGQKAIVVSGFSQSADVQRVMELGGCGFLKKPYTMLELGQAVYDALLNK